MAGAINPRDVVWDDAAPQSGGINPADITWDDEAAQGQSGLRDFIQRGRQFNADVKSAAVAGLRDLGQGAANLISLPGTIGVMGYNALTGSNVQTPAEALDASLDTAGVPKTQNRYIRGINQALGGSLAGIGTGTAMAAAQSPVAAGVGRTLAAAPAQQLGGAVGGAASSQFAADVGLGPLGQSLAGIGGGAIGGGLLRQGTVEGIKRSFRGGEQGRQTVRENISLFEQAAGRTPSVGQATQNRRMQGAESMLSRTPGGAGVMAREGAALADDVSASLERKAAQLSPKADAEQAGRVIQRQISGEGGFVEKFKATQSQLYDQLDNYIPQNAEVSVGNTRAALAALNQDIKNAPALSEWFKNAKIQGIEAALGSDTAIPPGQLVIPPTTRIGTRAGSLGEPVQTQTQVPEQRIPIPGSDRGWMPYESVKKLRTLVGNEMADAGFMSDVPRSKWKALYAALSKDLEAAAGEAGPNARQAYSRANTYTRAGMARLDTISHVIEKNGGPEKVFGAALAGTQEGATTLRAVMQSLDKDGQKMISASVLRRLGRATPGTQNAEGSAFSTESFLTNWNRLSPQAKATLFDRYGPGFRADMDKVARLAGNLREGSQVFRNPSGTAQATGQLATVAGVAGALGSGNIPAAAYILMGVGAANLSGRLLTHPPFVKWLATTTQRPAGALPAAINQLAQSKDPLMQEAAAALSQQQGQQPGN